MFGLIRKSLRETAGMTLLFGLAAALLLGLLTWILPRIMEQLGPVLDQMKFFRSLLTALIGSELSDNLTPESMQAYLWVHPVLLALVWAHEIIFCTRVPVGEIDRGTVDLLLSLPVSRRRLYVIESLLWLASGAWVLAVGWLGHAIIAPFVPEEYRPRTGDIARIMTNLYFVYIAVGGMTWWVSSFSRRRGRAISAVFAIVLVSFLLNFLAQFWEPAKSAAMFSVMDYYKPAILLREQTHNLRHLTVLGAMGLFFWLLGLETFARRDIAGS